MILAALEQQALVALIVYSSDGLSLLKTATQALSKHMEAEKMSSVYKIKGSLNRFSHVHDIASVDGFQGITVAVKGFIKQGPEQFVKDCMNVEEHMNLQDKTLEIVVLCVEDLTRMQSDLCLPYPEWHRRVELLVPSSEVWGDYQHPILGESVYNLSQKMSDKKWGSFFAQGKSLLES